jgi:hypothetical protein
MELHWSGDDDEAHMKRAAYTLCRSTVQSSQEKKSEALKVVTSQSNSMFESSLLYLNLKLR